MKIIVAVKQVPSRDSLLRVGAQGDRLDGVGLRYELNGPDAYALEEALRLREKLGGEVVVLCAGPERVTVTIREVLAKGADRAIHVRFSETETPDPFTVATALARAAQTETPDFLLTGLQSEDLCSGGTAVMMAELLGFAHAAIVTEIEPSSTSVRVKRELEGGWHQYVTLPLPAVLTIQSGTKKPRLATMMGIKKARGKDIRVLELSDPVAGTVADQTIERLYLPVRQKSSGILSGDARECAKQLAERLRFEARVL